MPFHIDTTHEREGETASYPVTIHAYTTPEAEEEIANAQGQRTTSQRLEQQEGQGDQDAQGQQKGGQAEVTAYYDRLQAGAYQGNEEDAKPDEVQVVAEPEPAPQPEDPEPEDPADQYTLAELRDMAEGKGLPTYGTKAQLLERLNNAD